MKPISVSEAFDVAGTDKGYSHGYGKYYDRIFRDFTPKTLLEIGVHEGHSMLSWRLAFPECKLFGIDITDGRLNPTYIDFAEADVVIGDSTHPSSLDKLRNKYDVIIDDGSHFYKDIIKSFLLLHNRFEYCYVIEDAMYKQDFIVKMIKKCGFNRVEVFDSRVQNARVRRRMMSHKPYHEGMATFVDLKLIIVYRS